MSNSQSNPSHTISSALPEATATPTSPSPASPVGGAPLGSIVKSTTTSPVHAAARERIRRQLDELQANIISEHLRAKALTPVAPLVLLPITPLIPLRRKSAIDVPLPPPRGQKAKQLAPPPKLPTPENPRECPCGQLFSRPEHVLRHRARNICIAGLDHPGEPRRKSVGGNTLAVKPPTGSLDYPEESPISTMATLPIDIDPPLPISQRAATGSRSTSHSEVPPRVEGKPELTAPRFQCECGRGFGHVGNYDRHRKAGKCQIPSEIKDVSKVLAHVVERNDRVCECGKWYTHSHSLLRHIKQNVCNFGDPKATLAALPPGSPPPSSMTSSVPPDELHVIQPTGKKRQRGLDEIDEVAAKKLRSSSSPSPSGGKRRGSLRTSRLRTHYYEDMESEEETLMSTGTKSSRTQSVA